MRTTNTLALPFICTSIGLLYTVTAFQKAVPDLRRTPTGFQKKLPQQPMQLQLEQEQRHVRRNSAVTDLKVSHLRDADFIEMMVGGERYEMVPLPDSMVPTTVFVGNLCEFVNDDILSDLFQAVSTLSSVPACVARKANTNSLHYGFVTFPTVEEKEAAILRFHGSMLHGKRIKVENIKIDPSFSRVRVPERMVLYACGEAKRTRDGGTNTMRRISSERVSKNRRMKKQRTRRLPNHKAKSHTNNIRLNEKEQQSMDRAIRRGYVELAGTGYRRGRKGSALATMHRQWCDEHARPQIILCKATGGRPLDNVIVDLSPLRMGGLFNDNPKFMGDFLLSWKKDILTASSQAGMELRDDYVEDNSIRLLQEDEEDYAPQTEYVIAVNAETLMERPIFELPAVSMGVFEGDRSKARQMAKYLANLWGIPQQVVVECVTEGARRKSKRHSDESFQIYKNKIKAARRNKRREREFW